MPSARPDCDSPRSNLKARILRPISTSSIPARRLGGWFVTACFLLFGVASAVARFPLGFGDLIDQLDEAAADRAVRDSRKRGQQTQRALVRNELDRRGARRALVCGRIRIGVEEGADRDTEYRGDLRKAPGADPVDALFVFLNLLK